MCQGRGSKCDAEAIHGRDEAPIGSGGGHSMDPGPAHLPEDDEATKVDLVNLEVAEVEMPVARIRKGAPQVSQADPRQGRGTCVLEPRGMRRGQVQLVLFVLGFFRLDNATSRIFVALLPVKSRKVAKRLGQPWVSCLAHPLHEHGVEHEF